MSSQVNEHFSSAEESYEQTEKSNSKYFIWLLVATIPSILGTNLTDFALGQWVYQKYQSATTYGLIGFVTLAPQLILSPLFGTIIDKYPRVKLMIIGHLVAGVCSLLLLILFFSNTLWLWALIILVAVGAIFNGLVYQVFKVLIPVLVPKVHLGRAQGVVRGLFGIIQVVVPAAAAFLLGKFDLELIFIIDIITFILAIVLSVVLANFLGDADGREKPSQNNDEQKINSFATWKQHFLYGVNYLKQNTRLLQLVSFFTIASFFIGVIQALFTPLILSFTDLTHLGNILAIAGIGTISGSLIMGVWGGLNKRVLMMFINFSMLGVVLMMSIGFFSAPHLSVTLISIMVFILTALVVIISSDYQVIWQVMVPKHIQGRVLGIQELIVNLAYPLALLIAGPLADYVFIPLMSEDGLLAVNFGQFIGVGPEVGIALLYSISGVMLLINVVGFSVFSRTLTLDKDVAAQMSR
ncbi:MFS transporter [Endozoicomonas sp. SM1973]|uniref:MFS transporter n=1 Tax=Spartinivicinus marinus TaxID=2994442 RepID=A0A853I7K8_9GAMM|nr:MFS transporter [Spartinivicinus marinus]MCX4029586.1 MFS transporter [Spartinivicinus marinus]NYZ68799.1 MFS transporter [Spartinivicinus marinus]